MSDTTSTTKPERRFERVCEQIHDFSAGFRKVVTALAVPAGVPEDDDCEEEDGVDPDGVRDEIIQVRLDEESDRSEEFVT